MPVHLHGGGEGRACVRQRRQRVRQLVWDATGHLRTGGQVAGDCCQSDQLLGRGQDCCHDFCQSYQLLGRGEDWQPPMSDNKTLQRQMFPDQQDKVRSLLLLRIIVIFRHFSRGSLDLIIKQKWEMLLYSVAVLMANCTTTGARWCAKTAVTCVTLNNLNKKDILGWEPIDNNGRSGKHVYEVPAPFCLNKLYR